MIVLLGQHQFTVSSIVNCTPLNAEINENDISTMQIHARQLLDSPMAQRHFDNPRYTNTVANIINTTNRISNNAELREVASMIMSDAEVLLNVVQSKMSREEQDAEIVTVEKRYTVSMQHFKHIFD